ncbi:MAG: restriction endonuclease [Candidatus Methylomirabilis sp.]|nr:restriction endonuclease [Deltaproteobacteria bacterium]
MGIELLPKDLRALYEIHEWRHACAVLSRDFPKEWDDLIRVLRDFRLLRGDVEKKGGNKSAVATALDSAFYARGWRQKSFETSVVVDDATFKSPTHEVDCFKNGVALEVEWNNKDPFYDRDLNNFRLLFDLRAISVGVIVTRSDEIQAVFKKLGKGKATGASTTQMSKLLPRIEGGGGGGCPILAFGITTALYVED